MLLGSNRVIYMDHKTLIFAQQGSAPEVALQFAKALGDYAHLVKELSRAIGDSLAVDPHTLAAGGDTFRFKQTQASIVYALSFCPH